MEYQQLLELKKKTKVFGNVPAIVHRVSWVRCGRIKAESYQPSVDDYGFAHVLIENQEGLPADYSNGLDYYVFDSESYEVESMFAEQLPIEFFNHQLFELGRKSEDRALTLMEEWGFLFSPLRNDWACLDGWQFLETMSMQGVKETDLLVERMPQLAGIAVSKLEAQSTLAVLKETVLFLRKYIRSGGEDVKSLSMLVGPLNSASCNPLQVEATSISKHTDDTYADMIARIRNEALDLSEPDRAHVLETLDGNTHSEFPLPLCQVGMLTSAICNQILDTVAIEDVPWRECACTGCDVIFKYPQSKAEKLMQDVYYCCPKHGARERKRKSRARRTE